MYIVLLQNAALLVALTALYGQIIRIGSLKKLYTQILIGVLFGLVAIAGMRMPLRYAPGIVYDGRSIILSVSGLFGGTVIAVVSAIIAGAYRAYMGGYGVWAGLATIITCPIVGLICRHLSKNQPENLSLLKLWGFGFLVHIVMLTCQLLIIPIPSGAHIISKIWLPVLTVFPIATVLMGSLLASETKKLKAEQELRSLTEELELRVAQRTAQLREANRVLEDFAHSVSHDLKAPLRAIRGFAEIIERRYGENLNEEARHYLDNILDASTRMEQLIGDLLAYARVGRGESLFEVIDLSSLIEGILPDFEAKEVLKDAEIIVEPLPMIRGSQTLVRQIFSNLIDNALKYRKEEGKHLVKIYAETSGGVATVYVSDNGIGIAPEHHERIFNIFQRLHSRDHYRGSGAGLAIVRRAVEQLGGSIGVSSKPGEGSTFWVKLPLATPAIQPQNEGKKVS